VPSFETPSSALGSGRPLSSPVTVTVRLLRHASSETVPFELSLVNLLDDSDRRGFVVSACDITARVAAELEAAQDPVAAHRNA